MRGDLAGVKYKSGRFWGVTRQQGPWESTPMDKKRDDGVQVRKAGGGIGIGIGNENNGNRNSRQVMNPYTVDATRAPSTKYHQQTIVLKKDYKKGSQVLGKRKLPSDEIGLMKKMLKALKPDPKGTYPSYGDDPSGGDPSGGDPSGKRPSIKSEASDSPRGYLQDTQPGMLERLASGVLPRNSIRTFGF
jgi:hypothetical protein